jgi:O-acetyl-ADP-ribose deacetylase (regulator of RNase III)
MMNNILDKIQTLPRVRTVSIDAMCTGIYGYPKDVLASGMIRYSVEWLEQLHKREDFTLF